MKTRFPLPNPVLDSKLYEILDGQGHKVAHLTASNASDAMEEARKHWPESRSAIAKKNFDTTQNNCCVAS